MTLVDSASQGGMGSGGGVGQGGPPDELSTLWSLVAELSSQLTANRELCVSLQQQAEHLKGQVHHNNNGFALRRFNVDVSKEKFESELERINVQLVKENTQLQYENKQLNALLREHEQTIEAVMVKFRNFSHSTQHHILELTQHYEGLLGSQSYQQASTSLHATTQTASTLSHLGDLVRRAIRAIDGEVDEEDLEGAGEYDSEEEEEEDEYGDAEDEEAATRSTGANEGALDEDEGGPASRALGHKGALRQHLSPANAAHSALFRRGSGSSRRSVRTAASTHSHQRTDQGSAHYSSSFRVASDPRFYGSGGYFGKWGDPAAQSADQALESLTEEEKLRSENEMLRKLLLIAEEPPLPLPLPIQQPPNADKSGEGVNKAEELLPLGVVSGGLPGSEKLSLGIPRGKMQKDKEKSPTKSPIGPSSPPIAGVASMSTSISPVSTLLRTPPGGSKSPEPTSPSTGAGTPAGAPAGSLPVLTLQTLKRSSPALKGSSLMEDIPDGYGNESQPYTPPPNASFTDLGGPIGDAADTVDSGLPPFNVGFHGEAPSSPVSTRELGITTGPGNSALGTGSVLLSGSEGVKVNMGSGFKRFDDESTEQEDGVIGVRQLGPFEMTRDHETSSRLGVQGLGPLEQARLAGEEGNDDGAAPPLGGLLFNETPKVQPLASQFQTISLDDDDAEASKEAPSPAATSDLGQVDELDAPTAPGGSTDLLAEGIGATTEAEAKSDNTAAEAAREAALNQSLLAADDAPTATSELGLSLGPEVGAQGIGESVPSVAARKGKRNIEDISDETGL